MNDHVKQHNSGIKNLLNWTVSLWKSFQSKHPTIAQFTVFFIVSNGVTVLQLVLMPLFRYLFSFTDLINTSFQFLKVGTNLNGDPHYMFDFAEGSISSGGNGGLAYFLAMSITLAIAQIINFFAQRSITFKSNTNPWIAAMWYFIAYILITVIASIALGFYQVPIYTLLRDTWGMGARGETIADILVMIINSAISFWVFYPIFKIIFKRKPEIN